MKTISNKTEYEQIIAGDKPVVLDFYADWCSSCTALLPVLEAASNDYAADIVVAKINVEVNPELAAKFGIRSIPAVILMKNATVVDRFAGVQSRSEINKRIDHLISVKIEKPGMVGTNNESGVIEISLTP